MYLRYHKGKNFGDAINPMIFNHFIGDLLDNDESVVVLGIGSIFGLYRPRSKTKKVYCFSTGYAAGAESTYGKPPELTDVYDIICVRGRLTAQALNINKNLAISDGALLLPFVYPYKKNEFKYDFSYMPHVGSLDVYNKLQGLLETCGIHLIDPRKCPKKILEELFSTKVLLTEALHGAIAADAYGIRYIAIKTIKTINAFKWRDYLSSVEMDYQPVKLPTLYSYKFLKGIFENKLKKYGLERNCDLLSGLAAAIYYIYQESLVKYMFLIKLRRLKRLSLDNRAQRKIVHSRQKQLLRKMMCLRKKIIFNHISS